MSWAQGIAGDVVEVLRHDVAADPPPAGGFDLRQIRGQLVAAGLATDEEIDRHLANVNTGLLDLATAPLVSAGGRRP